MKQSNQAPFMTTDYGYVYVGFDKMDEEDLALLDAYLQSGGMSLEDAKIDPLSECGRLAREYTAEIWERGETGTKKLGGEGSHTYETQKVIGRNYGSGDVTFKEEGHDAIWHGNPSGERVHGVLDYPRTGTACHVDEYGQTTAGPKVGSKAERRLGDGQYKWNKKNAWWVIRA